MLRRLFRFTMPALGLSLLVSQATGEAVKSDYRYKIPPVTAPVRQYLQMKGPESPPTEIPPGELLPLPKTAPSPAPSRLTLPELEGMALGNNPALAEAGAFVRAAQGHWKQVGLYPNLTAGYVGNQIGDNGTQGQQGIYVEQEFVTGHKLRLNRAVASQEVSRLQRLFAAKRLQVLNDVRIAYFEVLVADQTRSLTSELVRIGDEGARTADDLFRAEQVSQVDVLQARIEAQSARIQHRNAENRYNAAWKNLAAVVGIPELQQVPLVGDLEESPRSLSWEGALAQIYDNSPELAAAQARVARASWSIRRARVEPIPNLDVQYYPQYDNTVHDNIHSVQATVEVPIFDRNQGAIRRAQAELVAARNEVGRVQLDLQQRLAQDFERYTNAQQQVETYARNILPDATRSLELVSKGYRNSEFDYLTLLVAQRTFFQTNLAYLASLQELQTSAVAIEGLLLTGSLKSAPEPVELP
jgi:cobalt-zinc-cadmium efflux system outer membrane protein